MRRDRNRELLRTGARLARVTSETNSGSIGGAEASAPVALDPHDVSLIERKLRLSLEERIEELVTAVAFIAELRAEMAKARSGAA